MLYIVKSATGEVVATFTTGKAATDLAADLEIMTGTLYTITIQQNPTLSRI